MSNDVRMSMWHCARTVHQDIADRCEEFHQLRWGIGYPPIHVSMKRLNNVNVVVTEEWWWK